MIFLKRQEKDSRQRYYSDDDLKKLLSISFLYHNGRKISKIAFLTNDEIAVEVRKIEMEDINYKTYVQRLLHAAIDFNEAAFLEILNQLIEKIGFEKTITDVSYPHLEIVEFLGDSKNVIPAQEHFASYIIQNRLISETEKFSQTQHEPPELILFSPGNKHHELPLLYLNYLLRKYGWKVLYLGKNTKLDDVKEAAQLPTIKYLYVHTITNFTGYSIDDYLENLRKSFPGKMVIASGKGIGESRRSFLRMQLLKKMWTSINS